MNLKFSERLKALMEEKAISIRELSEILGISRHSLGNYIANKTIPNIEVLYGLADYFSVSTDYLLGRASERDLVLENKLLTLGLEGSSTKILEKLNKDARSDYREAAYILLILNILIQDMEYSEDSMEYRGFLCDLVDYLILNREREYILIDKLKFLRAIDSEDLKNLQDLVQDQSKLIEVKESSLHDLSKGLEKLSKFYYETYGGREDFFLDMFSGYLELDDDGFVFDEDKDLYYRDGKYYYSDGEGYYETSI